MAKLKWLSASIVVDGEELDEIVDEEAQDQEETCPLVTRYVQVAEGYNFGIKVAAAQGYPLEDSDGLLDDIHLDGSEKDNRVWTKDDELKNGSYEDIYKGVEIKRNGQWLFQRLRFSKLHLGETGGHGHDLSNLTDDLGTITVKFWRWKSRKPGKKRKVHRASLNLPPAGGAAEATGGGVEVNEVVQTIESMPEKALKGKAIHVTASLGKAERCRVPNVVSGYSMDKDPVGVFIFKYRTLEALKQMHLIPRTPSPIPLEARPLESLTEAEKTELIMRMRNEVVATKSKIKQERQERNLRVLQPSKRSRAGDHSDDEIEEIGARPAKRRGPDPESAVIDLAD